MRLSRGDSVAALRGARPSAAPRPGPRGRPGGAAFAAWRADPGPARGAARAPGALPGLGWLRRREGDGESEGESEASERARRRAELLFGAEAARELARQHATVEGPADPDGGLAARWRRLRRNARRRSGEAGEEGGRDAGAGGEAAEGRGAGSAAAAAAGEVDGGSGPEPALEPEGSGSESALEPGDWDDESSSDDADPASSRAQRSVDALFDPLAAGPAPPPLADVAAVAEVEPEDMWWLRRNRYALKARHIREQLPQYDALFRQEEEDRRRDEALRAEIAEAVRREERAERAREAEQAQREAAARRRSGRTSKGVRPWTIPELWPRGKTPTERDLHEGIDALLRSRIRDALEGRADEDDWDDAQLVRALAGLPPMQRTHGDADGEGAGGDGAAGSEGAGGAGGDGDGAAGVAAGVGSRNAGAVLEGAGDKRGNAHARRLASASASASASTSASASASASAWAVAPPSADGPSPTLSVPPPLPFPSGSGRRLWRPRRGVSPKDPNAEVPERYSESDSDEEWELREAPRHAERPDVEVTLDFVESIGARLVGVPSTALADPGGRSVTALLEAESAARWRFRLSKATPENAMRLLAAEGREVARDADRLRRDAADLAKRVAELRKEWKGGEKGRQEGQTEGPRIQGAAGGGQGAVDGGGGRGCGRGSGDATADASRGPEASRQGPCDSGSGFGSAPTPASAPAPASAAAPAPASAAAPASGSACPPPFPPALPSALSIPALAPILFPNGEEDYVDPDAPQPPRAAFVAALRFLRTRGECEAAAGALVRRGDAVVMRAARAHWLYLTFNPRTASDASLAGASALEGEPRVRFKLQSHYPQVLDDAVNRLLVTAHFTGARASGPVFMPTRRQTYSFLRSPHVNKTSQEQYEARWHTRLVDVLSPTPATYAAIARLNMPGGLSSTVMFQAEIDALRARGAAAKARRRRIREGRPTAEDDAVTRRVEAERLERRKQSIRDELERMALAKAGDAGDRAWDARVRDMAERYRQAEREDDDLYRRLQEGRAQIYRTLDRVSESGGSGAKRLAKAYRAAIAIAERRDARDG